MLFCQREKRGFPAKRLSFRKGGGVGKKGNVRLAPAKGQGKEKRNFNLHREEIICRRGSGKKEKEKNLRADEEVSFSLRWGRGGVENASYTRG